jgi:NitT/TauT family transport system ATP-binding protein
MKDQWMSVNAATAQATSVLCEARHISHDFILPNGRPLRVLNDISLTIRADEVVALLGPSGCGKSTVLRILAGLINPTQGDVLHHGELLRGLNPGVAIVFQSFALYPWLTVMQNIQVVLAAAGLAGGDVDERVQQTIRLVGLAGFEEAFPRELSGGMKQRVGMARALVVDPEILFLDEPFSQVDALTAESLRAEVLDIWVSKERNPSAVLMVSHDITEVAYMADRIVILGANPATVRTVIENHLSRPRDYRSPELHGLVDHLHDLITGSELPDIPPTAAKATGYFEPLPEASSSEIVGLLEYLDARSGTQDLFRIASDTNREFGRMMSIAKAAEMFEFVDTPKRLVVLESLGKQFLEAEPERRKQVWREQLLKLQLFREVNEVLQRQTRHEVEREFVLETIIMRMPQENYERVFDTFIRWARFGDLFSYSEETDTVSLQ